MFTFRLNMSTVADIFAGPVRRWTTFEDDRVSVVRRELWPLAIIHLSFVVFALSVIQTQSLSALHLGYFISAKTHLLSRSTHTLLHKASDDSAKFSASNNRHNIPPILSLIWAARQNNCTLILLIIIPIFNRNITQID